MREQAKAIFVWYPKARIDLKMIHDENDVLMDDALVVARGFLKESKYACLYIRSEFPGGFKLLNNISTVQSLVQSNDTYVYGVGMLAVLATGVCVFFVYNTFPKKLVNAKQDQSPKRRHML